MDPKVRASTSQLKLGGKIAEDFSSLACDAKERLTAQATNERQGTLPAFYARPPLGRC